MVGWYRITYNTNGWTENKDIIVNGIKPVVDSLEKTSFLINFFFLDYCGNDNRVTFTFYGNKSKVEDKFYLYLQRHPNQIEKWRQKNTNWRFEEDYPFGVKLMEIGSRLALCRIGNKYPIEKSSGNREPITTILRHVYLQNLGYSSREEGIMAGFVDLPLLQFYHQFLGINIK